MDDYRATTTHQGRRLEPSPERIPKMTYIHTGEYMRMYHAWLVHGFVRTEAVA